MKTEIKKLQKSQVQIDFELDEQEFNKYVDKALEHLKSHVKMDGFRPGAVPKEMVEKQVGQENLLMEVGDLAVKESYTKYVNENNVEPVSPPEVQIKKIVPIPKESRILDGEAIGTKGPAFIFTVRVSVLPEFVLPDYKKIAGQVKAQEISVEEKEIEDALVYLQKSRAKFSQVDRAAAQKDFVEIEYKNENINQGKLVKDRFVLGEGGFLKDFEDQVAGMKAGDEKEFKARFPENAPNNMAGKESVFKVKMLSVQAMELPDINDEFAKSMGGFDSLVVLKQNIKEGIGIEKGEAEKQRKRGEILQKIAEKVSVDLPEILIESEQVRMLEGVKQQVSQSGASFAAQPELGEPRLSRWEDYLKSIKKTEEEIKKSFRKDAEKRITQYLVLRKISDAEHIEVPTEEIEEEMNKMVKNYSPAQMEKIDINRLKEYTKDTILNEKIFQLLEKLSQN